MAWYDAAARRLVVPLSAATFGCEAPAAVPRAPDLTDGLTMWSAFV
jgi:hypothetical protein